MRRRPRQFRRTIGLQQHDVRLRREELRHLEQRRRKDDRRREQERKARGVLVIEVAEQSRDHRDARTRNARQQRERLRDADNEARRIAQLLDRLIGLRRLAACWRRRNASPANITKPLMIKNERGRRRRAEEPPHRNLEDDAEDADRNRADDEQPADSFVAIVAQTAAHDARDERANDRVPFRAIEHDQRERRSQVQDDDKGEKRRVRAIDVVPVQQRRNQDRVPQARDREEFAHALQ